MDMSWIDTHLALLMSAVGAITIHALFPTSWLK